VVNKQHLQKIFENCLFLYIASLEKFEYQNKIMILNNLSLNKNNKKFLVTSLGISLNLSAYWVM